MCADYETCKVQLSTDNEIHECQAINVLARCKKFILIPFLVIGDQPVNNSKLRDSIL